MAVSTAASNAHSDQRSVGAFLPSPLPLAGRTPAQPLAPRTIPPCTRDYDEERELRIGAPASGLSFDFPASGLFSQPACERNIDAAEDL